MLRQRIADIAQAEYEARDFDAVAAALSTPRHDVEDHTPGGYELAATRLTHAEIAAVLAALEAFARSEHPDAGITSHGLRKFSAGQLDFALAESQAMFAALPVLSGGKVTEAVAARLAAVGVRTESDADQLNKGEPYTADVIAALHRQEQRDRLSEDITTALHRANTVVHNAGESDPDTVPTWAEIVAAFTGE